MQVAVVMSEEEMESMVVMSLFFFLFVPFERESAKGKRMKKKEKKFVMALICVTAFYISFF